MPKASGEANYGKRPRWVCCNRCALYLGEFIEGLFAACDEYACRNCYSCVIIANILTGDLGPACNAQFGIAAKKCKRCADGKHGCVELDKVNWPNMRRVLEARDTLAALRQLPNITADQIAQTEQRVRDAAEAIKDMVRAMNPNRSKTTGDMRTPRKKGAGAALGGSGDLAAAVLELQAIRRAMQGMWWSHEGRRRCARWSWWWQG
ncbi:hypothetical protein KC316_g11062 [Hortaea werneckii]|nr:hypothetical protein KC324_g10960 [Hortaea werneckii]KAI7575494.1 hypothetical protein KC316_g11062 [Hortaea werneckii]